MDQIFDVPGQPDCCSECGRVKELIGYTGDGERIDQCPRWMSHHIQNGAVSAWPLDM